MPTNLNLLLLEDSPADAELMIEALRDSGFDPNYRRVDTKDEYLRELNQPPDFILSDYSMPQFTAQDALRLMKERGLDLPFIIVSGCIGEDMAVECMKAGAADFPPPPADGVPAWSPHAGTRNRTSSNAASGTRRRMGLLLLGWDHGTRRAPDATSLAWVLRAGRASGGVGRARA